jgi:TolA-binding protein
MPLPLISLYTAVPGAEGISEPPPPAPLSPEAAKALGTIRGAVRKKTPEIVKKKRAFDQDLEVPAGGEEYPLRSIVQGAFAKGDWKSSVEELLRYLSLPRSRTSEARARFYLGQAYYFSGVPREALFEFLFVQSYYPEEAREWVQASLALLVKKE